MLRAALNSVDARELVRAEIERAGGRLGGAGGAGPDSPRLVLLAAGKAAAPMAAALESATPGVAIRGLAVTKEGYGGPLRRIELIEAGHPVPDARSVAAARRALELVSSSRPDETLVVLLSGGASSLLACPQPGLTLDDLARTTSLLLASGADIDEQNVVRKHLTELSGGRLARRATSRRIEVLAVSDVAGDRLDVIGSGPCAPDPSTFADALAVLETHALLQRVPRAVCAHLEQGARGGGGESPKPGDPALRRVRSTILASNRDARAAAARWCRARGVRAVELAGELRGEAREAGRRLVGLGRAVRSRGRTVLLAGGETTVTLRGTGRGGRNQELALAAALALAGEPRVALLAAGTDGSDGPTDAAGAFVDGGSVSRGTRRGVDARDCLERNDSHGFFAAEGGLLFTGPTRTNVRDLAFVLVDP